MAVLNITEHQALEPHISGEIMELHHTKHHQTYVNGLNTAEEAYTKASRPKEQIKLQAALKFNGGGALPVYSSASPVRCTKYRLVSMAVVQDTSTTLFSGRTSPPALLAEDSCPKVP